MNSGAEAVETALKLTRRWGHDQKKIPENQAKIIVCDDNFHGRTLGIISASTDPDSRRGFGPYLPGYIVVPYGDADALEVALKDPTVAGFMFEPIQGEAGVVVPPEGYLKRVRELTRSSNVLMVADEVQTGLGRTGKMLACDHESVKPDVLILGKALSGGVLPVSAVLASDEVMLTLKPGEHGSTFGGNPLACRVARAALDVILEEGLIENAQKLGEIFRNGLREIESPYVELVRGKGLLNAAVIRPHGKNEHGSARTAKDVCYDFAALGLLAKQTHVHTIRFAPPLVISEELIHRGLSVIRKVLKS
jgi:ornithine--oxo-acid transaminase